MRLITDITVRGIWWKPMSASRKLAWIPNSWPAKRTKLVVSVGA
jgi:hypothetical protein